MMRKKIGVCGLALAALLCGAVAAQAENAPIQPLPLAQAQQPKVCTETTTVLPGQFIAKRGCCSHHKGVCGCKNGRQECCDGSLSPSCKCQADDRTEGGAE